MSTHSRQPGAAALPEDARFAINAQKWLGANTDGVDVLIECMTMDDSRDGPNFVRIRVDQAFLVMLQKRTQFCASQNARDITEVRSPDSWDGDKDSISFWTFYVDRQAFHFKGSSSTNGDVMVDSAGLRLHDLARRLAGNSHDPKSESEQDAFGSDFKWFGESLLYSRLEAQAHFEHVKLAHPELVAKQIALEMRARLDSQPTISAPAKQAKRTQMKV